MKLEYKNSFFAFFNPPNLKDLTDSKGKEVWLFPCVSFARGAGVPWSVSGFSQVCFVCKPHRICPQDLHWLYVSSNTWHVLCSSATTYRVSTLNRLP